MTYLAMSKVNHPWREVRTYRSVVTRLIVNMRIRRFSNDEVTPVLEVAGIWCRVQCKVNAVNAISLNL